MAAQHWLTFPVIVEIPGNNSQSPDYLLRLGADRELGIEVTEAGAATWQRWMTEAGPAGTDNTVQLYPTDGYVGDEPERIIVRDVIEAVSKKTAKHAEGAYKAARSVDLLVYENSEGGLLANRRAAVNAIRTALRDLSASTGFRQIHLIYGDHVFLDVAGEDFAEIEVSSSHGDDWAAWLETQARLLRQHNFNAVDTENLAEELDSLARSDQRAFKSQIRRLLIHLLKCLTQPKKRNKSWDNSIGTARDELESIIDENPSFENRYWAAVQQEYSRARRAAAREMKVSVHALPDECPFTVDELRDPDFFPGLSQ